MDYISGRLFWCNFVGRSNETIVLFSKCLLSVIVIVLNYILSKKMVFHKQRENGVADESIQ